MQNRFTHCKEKYKLLVNLKVQSFFVLFCCGLWLLSQIKEKGDTTVLKMSKAVLGSLLCMKQCKGVVCWKPLVGATSFSLVRERCREASETECSHEPGVILAFPTSIWRKSSVVDSTSSHKYYPAFSRQAAGFC